MIGYRLKYFRKMAGISQETLASKIGYSGSGPISLIEAGKRGLSVRRAIRAAEILDVDAATLLLGSNKLNRKLFSEIP